MARGAITVLKMTTVNSSVSVVPTLASITSGTATGLYINVGNIDASRMILVFTRAASGTNAAIQQTVTMKDGDSHAGYTGYGVGDLSIDISSAGRGTDQAGNLQPNLVFAGPFETARFKDSDGYIKINATRATNVRTVGAILV